MKVEIEITLKEFALNTSSYKSLERKSNARMFHEISKEVKRSNFWFRDCDLGEILENVSLLQKYLIHSKIKITA